MNNAPCSGVHISMIATLTRQNSRREGSCSNHQVPALGLQIDDGPDAHLQYARSAS